MLRLVADGLTNAAISERLFLSPRTVETHVANLLTKSGTANRQRAPGLVPRANSVAGTDPRRCRRRDRGGSTRQRASHLQEMSCPAPPPVRRRRRRGRPVRPDHRRRRWPGPAYASWSSRSIPASRSFPRPPGCAPGTMEILRSWGLEDTDPAAVPGGPAGHGHPADAGRPRDEVSAGPAQPGRSSRRHSPSRLAVCPAGPAGGDPARAPPRPRRRGPVRHRAASACGSTTTACTVTVRSARGSESAEVQARYLVGADGAAAAVRDLLGIQVDQLGSEGHHLSDAVPGRPVAGDAAGARTS